MVIRDQLGPIRPEIYVGRSRSDGIYKPEVGHEFRRVHTEAEEAEFNGRPVLRVQAKKGAELGETALFAAYLHRTAGEDITVCFDGIELAVADLPQTRLAHMSDGEIERRFKEIDGANDLTTEDRRHVVNTALLIGTHFMMIINQDVDVTQATLFDE